MIDISQDQLQTIQAILKHHVPDYEVRAFGSRFTWTAKDYSDLDLAIVGPEKLPFKELSALRTAFEESDLPYRVDVLDWRALSPEFQKVIGQGYEVIQKPGLEVSSKGWKKYNLENVLEALIDYRGKTPSKTAFGIPLITAKIVKNGFIQQPDEFIAEEDYNAWMVRGLPQVGDVVLTTEAPLGEVAQIKDNRVALAQRIITLRGKSGVLNNGYLKYFLQSEIGQARLKERETGTTVTGIKQSQLRLVKIDLPPIAIQRCIADILSALDAKIELNRQTNATLEAIAQAIFKEWFVDFNFPGATGEMQDSGLAPIPRGWEVGRFSDKVEIIGGGTPKTSVKEYWDGDIPWFSVVDAPQESNVFVIDTEKKITQAGIDNSSANLLPEGTTIISARGTVGRVALCGIPMAMNQSCYGLKGRQDDTGMYTYYLTRSISLQLQKGANGSVFDTITRNIFEQMTVVHPPEELIERFNVEINALMLRIKENLYESSVFSQIRDNLLPKLMSGAICLKEVVYKT